MVNSKSRSKFFLDNNRILKIPNNNNLKLWVFYAFRLGYSPGHTIEKHELAL